MRVLVGGVGYRFQGDLSFGLHVSDALAGHDDLGGDTHVDVMDLGYGALFVAQDLADVEPPYDRVILISAAGRGRPPGLYDVRPAPPDESVDEIQERIREAGAGVIDLDHLRVIGAHFGAFPPDLRVLEMEPVNAGPGEALSDFAERLLPDAIARVRSAAVEPAARDEVLPDPGVAVPEPDMAARERNAAVPEQGASRS